MFEPKYSIILPTYNRRECLKKALKSVLNQKNKDWELIIINDGTVEVNDLIPNDNRIIYIKNKETIGASASRNIGLRLARGNFIAYLDDDDEWLPNHLSLSDEILFKYDFIYSGAEIRENEKTINYLNKKFSYKELAKRNYIPLPSVIHSKSLISRSGLWNEKLCCLQDWELWCRMLRKTKKVYHRDSITVIINLHKNSITSKTAGKKIRNKIINNIKLRYFIPLILRNYLSKVVN